MVPEGLGALSLPEWYSGLRKTVLREENTFLSFSASSSQMQYIPPIGGVGNPLFSTLPRGPVSRMHQIEGRRAAPARYLTVLRGATIFLSRGPPGGCPVCVLSGLERMQRALAEPLLFSVRDAHFVLPLNTNRKHARFARGASLETRASSRPRC